MKTVMGIVIFVPLAVMIGGFAVQNRTPLSLEMWPLDGIWTMWASLWVLIPVALGTLFGMSIGWLSGAGWRRRARRAERRVEQLEREADAYADTLRVMPSTTPSATGGDRIAMLAQQGD